MKAALLSLLLLLGGAARCAVLDTFRDASRWTASASDQVGATLRQTRTALCLDADFNGVSGYAVLRRELPIDWPADFDLTLHLSGHGAVNDVQVKFVSGDDVWWVNRRDTALSARTTEWRLRRRHVAFAWGPAADRTLRSTRAVEFVVAAGRDGGRTTLCVSRLTLTPRAPDPAAWPEPTLHAAGDRLDIDLHALRDFNGLALRWPGPAGDYDVLASDDHARWRTLRRVRASDGGLDALWLPESQARRLRIQRRGGGGWPAVALRSAGEWPDANAVVSALAADAPRGDLPRAFLGQQNHWTLVGVDGGGDRSALLSEDGAIEVGRGGFSVEPALLLQDGADVTWNDVQAAQTLRDGALPLPAVHWSHRDVQLTVEAAADGSASAPKLLARYTIHNPTSERRRVTLLLAVRPWQVNPPQQFLTTPGGVRPLRSLQWRGGALHADGRVLRPTRAPDRVTALPFDGGLALRRLASAPPLQRLADPQQQASAAMQWDIVLEPGAGSSVGWTAALSSAAAPAVGPGGAGLSQRFDAVAAHWRSRLSHVDIDAGPDAEAIVRTLRTSLAHMLLSRDGAALRPGTRSYARTWIRDGAMMVAGLVRLGETDAARDFVDGYARHIYASGKVPCCVDARGADPVAENDSHGEYLYAVAEVWRHGGAGRETAFLARHWPRVQAVVAYQESLRQSTRNAATPPHLRGLLPPSISHEGYSDKPAYAYWDDFWALRGYKDTVAIARALGHDAQAAAWSQWRDEFERELRASIEASAALHGIDVVAGAADRGDFDPTSTSIALNPAQADLPPALLAATFDRYWTESLQRIDGTRVWRDYTPYELRNVGVFVRLGQPERAHALLRWFLSHQRPPGWNQWAEVVLPDAREPRFLGDMPHAWVSSDFVRSALDFFVHERGDDVLVIGAGWLPAWREHGIRVRGLSTAHGVLDLALTREAAGWTLQLPRPSGAAALLLSWPGAGPLPIARHDGRTLAWHGRELALPPPPFTIQLTTETTHP